MTDDEDDRTGLGFTLPPIRLPDVIFPAGLRIRIPGWASSQGNRLLAALALDGLDATVVLVMGDSLVRTFVGAAIVALLHGPIGLAYGVEVLPTLLDAPLVAIVPTATVITWIRDRSSAGRAAPP